MFCVFLFYPYFLLFFSSMCEDFELSILMKLIAFKPVMDRNGGIKGMFTGIGPRVARAGPSVGIVVSFYEVVKYTLFRYRYLED